MACDPNDLMVAAKCFNAIPPGNLEAVKTALLCQWASGGGPVECGTPSDLIQISGAGMAGANQLYEPNGLTQWKGVTDPTWVMDLFEGVWTLGSIDTPDQYASTENQFPCIWTLIPGGTGPAPTGIYTVMPGPAMAAAWSDQVVANGGAAPSAPTVAAVTTFINALFTANILAKMHVINCIVPDSAIAALTPLMKGTGFALWPDEGGLSSHLSVNGFQGGFSNTFCHTGVIPSVEFSSPNSSGASFYMRVASLTGSPLGVRSAGGASPWFELFIAVTSAVYVAYNSAVGSSEVHNLGGAGSWGFVSGSRVAANDMRIFSARSNVAWGQRGATNTNAPTTLPTDDVAFMASVHDTNSWTNTWSDFCSFFALHEGLSSAEGQALFNAVQAMRTAFGGGFG